MHRSIFVYSNTRQSCEGTPSFIIISFCIINTELLCVFQRYNSRTELDSLHHDQCIEYDFKNHIEYNFKKGRKGSMKYFRVDHGIRILYEHSPIILNLIAIKQVDAS